MTAIVVNVTSIRPYATPVPLMVSGFGSLKKQLKLKQTETTHIRVVFPITKCLNSAASSDTECLNTFVLYTTLEVN
jgi:hypothetical protein